MKKIILIIFVIININNSLLAADFVYNCNLDGQNKNDAKGKWSSIFRNFTISISKDKKYVEVYNKSIKLNYDDIEIIRNNDDFILAFNINDFITIAPPHFEIVSINKKTGYTQLSFLDGEGGTTLYFGYCKKLRKTPQKPRGVPPKKIRKF